MNKIEVTPIGVIHTCFDTKFGVPRQPNLAPHSWGEIELFPPYDDPASIDGLEEVSHIWLEFYFHKVGQRDTLSVRPPRLGGNQKLGVFATRSPYRPSGMGLSVVQINEIRIVDGRTRILVSGIDLVDGTPIIDIKPYVPYADAQVSAINNIAPMAPTMLTVVFDAEAESRVQLLASGFNYDFRTLVVEVLQQDPRPQYHSDDANRVYGVELCGHDVKFTVLGQVVTVLRIE